MGRKSKDAERKAQTRQTARSGQNRVHADMERYSETYSYIVFDVLWNYIDIKNQSIYIVCRQERANSDDPDSRQSEENPFAQAVCRQRNLMEQYAYQTASQRYVS